VTLDHLVLLDPQEAVEVEDQRDRLEDLVRWDHLDCPDWRANLARRDLLDLRDRLERVFKWHQPLCRRGRLWLECLDLPGRWDSLACLANEVRRARVARKADVAHPGHLAALDLLEDRDCPEVQATLVFLVKQEDREENIPKTTLERFALQC